MGKRGKTPKIPEGRGLYGGDAGDYAASADPLAYYNALQAQGGRTPTNTPADYWDWLQNEGFNAFDTGYKNALASDEQLTLKDYGAQAYGQSIGDTLGSNTATASSALSPMLTKKGKKGKKRRNSGNPFATGTGTGAGQAITPGVTPAAANPPGGSLGSQSDQQFLSFLAQTRPDDYFGSRLQDAGLFTGETPSDMNFFLMNDFYPRQYASYLGQRQNNASLGWDQYLA